MTQHPIATHLATSIRQATQPALRDYQQDGYDKIQSLWGAGYRNVLAVYPTGAGKCLGKDTPVLMYDGSIKPVQDVVPGDLLMGPDSQPRGVISTCTGREMLYRITPVKGDPYVVNESHILSLKKTGTDEIVNIRVKDYLTKSNNFKHLHKGWRAGVQYSPKRYSKYLPPYMLGVWLGDGTLRSASITSMDREVVDYLYEYANSTDQTIRIDNVNTGKASTYHFSANNRSTDSLRAELKRYELLGNTKFIPHHYKTGSRNQRLELLAGILDTDGHYDTKSYDIVFKQEQLAHDTAYIARSLGLAAYVKPCRKTATNTGATGTYFRISISGDFTDIPSKLNRNVFTPRLQKKSVLLTGINVEPVGEGDYYGFEITGDRLFMLGDFTVTHNTVLLSRIVFDHHGASCVIAHRQELVSQISIALARNGVRHRIIGPENVIRNIVQLHMFEIGMSFYDPNAQCAVAGVDTLVRRMGTGSDGDEYYYKDKLNQLWYYPPREYGQWFSPSKIDKLPEGERAQRVKPKDIDPQIAKWSPNVSLWVTDEAHHILRDNKWGKAITLFPNAKGLGVTATPERSDGAGLGRHADGVFDEMVVGPTMRDLIKRGYLTDYDIVVPPNNITLHDSDISKTTGDYKPQAITDAVEHSSLVGDDDGKRKVIGDIVTCYEKFAAGKLGVTFVPSIKIGEKVKAQFVAEGIAAELVTAETPDIERARILRKFKNRELMNLINVDLFGEGFDLPAIEVVSMARPTQSYGLYIQQFGRALRLMEGKKKALIIDHVGNVLGPRGHGLPDTPRQWTLDRRDKRSTTGVSDAITLRRCSNVDCFKAYERYMTVCPHCGTPIPEPIARNEPEFVDGDLLMLDSATLARLRGEVEQVDRPTQEIAEEYHAELQKRKCPQQYILGHVRKEVAKHEARKEAQNSMRDTFTVWAGYRRAEGRTDSEIYRQFYIMFGIDYMTAMTVDEARAIDLTCKMLDTLTS